MSKMQGLQHITRQHEYSLHYLKSRKWSSKTYVEILVKM